MRKVLLAIATVVAVGSASLLLPNRAEAMTVPAAAGLGLAAQEANYTDQVRWVCRRWWNGYSWRSRCWWVPGYYRYYRPRYYRYRYY